MNNGAQPLLDLRGVSKIYKARGSLFSGRGKDVVALKDLSLSIYKGEIFGLVGESGSGKTTAGRLIVSLEEITSGKIFLDQEEITGLRGKAMKRFRKKVQMIFQDPYQSLNPQMSILDTVSEPLKIHKVGSGSERTAAASEALRRVGLSPPGDFLYRHPHRLSGGQRQRVAIARAMILNPEVVIADEPTSMLDASISAQIFNILLNMRNALGVTLLFITHSLAAARYLCNRIGVIYKGHLMELGPAEEIIRNPKHPYTQALIDALPKFGYSSEMARYGTLLPSERFGEWGDGCVFYPRCSVADAKQCPHEKPALRSIIPGHQVACLMVGGEPDRNP